ncbi:MAG: hypothetical protein F6K16_00680 [Symploca sp. SIO2B6]|nr:hypothetical protein [Symploca sp. SIO2B6]
MLTEILHRFLTASSSKTSKFWVVFWLSLSVTFALIYSFIGLKGALSSEYVIQDDVRSHVFWMRRFFDPDLFPQDLITDYFQSVAPYGYATLYRLMANLGIDPVIFNKILPLVLILFTTVYCFGVCLLILPVPAAGFIATLFLNQAIWSTPEVPSATPRAFLYPLFLAFLYYLLKRSLLPCLVIITLQGLFYPHCLFLSSGILMLRVLRLKNRRLRFSSQRSDYLFCALGLSLSGIMLLPYALKISDFNPVISLAQAKTLPTLQESARKAFFFNDPLKYWFCGERSGMAPYDWCKNFPTIPAWIALFLPLLLVYRTRFPLTQKISVNVAVLSQIFLVSLGMFFTAHAFLFKLHLPSRYTKHSLRILVSLAGAIALIIILDAVLRACRKQTRAFAGGKQFLGLGLVVLLTFLIFRYPSFARKFPNANYVVGTEPSLYQFLAKQPQESLIASLSEEANNIPTFSRRSVLVSSETANPYHWGYYRQIKQRLLDLMQAQYSQDLTAAQDLIEEYGVDFLLLDRTAFTPEYIEKNRWLRVVEPVATEAVTRLRQGNMPALAKLQQSCSVFETPSLVVLQAECISRVKQESVD